MSHYLLLLEDFTFWVTVTAFVLGVVFVTARVHVQYSSRFKQLRKEHAPTCPKCFSDDGSYGGKAVDFAFQRSISGRLTSGLMSLCLLLLVAVMAWPLITLFDNSYYPLNITMFFAALGLLSARGLSLHAFGHFRSAHDNPEDVRWMCEKCSFDWVASEAPQSGPQLQPI